MKSLANYFQRIAKTNYARARAYHFLGEYEMAKEYQEMAAMFSRFARAEMGIELCSRTTTSRV